MQHINNQIDIQLPISHNNIAHAIIEAHAKVMLSDGAVLACTPYDKFCNDRFCSVEACYDKACLTDGYRCNNVAVKDNLCGLHKRFTPSFENDGQRGYVVGVQPAIRLYGKTKSIVLCSIFRERLIAWFKIKHYRCKEMYRIIITSLFSPLLVIMI